MNLEVKRECQVQCYLEGLCTSLAELCANSKDSVNFEIVKGESMKEGLHIFYPLLIMPQKPKIDFSVILVIFINQVRHTKDVGELGKS